MTNVARRAKNKGYRGEVEVIGILMVVLAEEYRAKFGEGVPPPELNRSPHGRDIRGLPWLALEVKFHEQESWEDQFTPAKVNGWWEQTKTNTPAGAVPVLIYRRPRGAWKVRMFGKLETERAYIQTPVDITLEGFLAWFRQRVRETLPGGVAT